MPPLVSIIIPAYNAAATIVEALESVAAQTLWVVKIGALEVKREEMSGAAGEFDYELIVVDDHSTDRTAEIVRKWISDRSASDVSRGLHASRFTLRVLPSNSGPAAARNAGIAAARGEWIAFLDADDLWAPKRLAIQLELAQRHPDAVLLCGRPAPFSEGARGKEDSQERHGRWGHERERRISLDELSEHNPIATSTVLVNRSVLSALGGFDARFRGPEDYDLWLRVAAYGEVYYTPAVLSRYRYGDLSLSTDDRKFLPQVLGVLEKAYAPGGALAGRRGRRRSSSHQHLAAAWMAAERGALGRAWRLWGRAWWLWPFRYGKYCRLPWGRLKLAVRFLKIALGRSGGVIGREAEIATP